jgi:AcrR family transcriptional regulator
MASSRNNRTAEDALLDAARDSIVAVGLRRTKLTDVALRAGVSRMTIYRRWPDMESLVGDLMTREWTGVTAAAMARADGSSVRQRIAVGMATGVTALRAHPMFRRILELDPEILLPYLIDRRGTSLDRMLGALVELLVEGQQDGSVRDGDPALLARGAMLAAQGFALSARTMTDEVSQEQLDAELLRLLDGYLAP